MDKQPIHDERIFEALDACRPGSDDVADAELAHLAAALADDPWLEDVYERLQKTDGVLAGSIQDVPVPDGLAGRLIERLAAISHPEEEIAAQPVVRPRRVSRRWLLVGGGSLTAAAVALVAMLTLLPPSQPMLTSTEVLQEGIRFFNRELPERGHLFSEKIPPAAYPFSPAVVQNSRTQWRSIPDFLGSEAVAYDLSAPGGAMATLYVVRRTMEGTPRTKPPRAPELPTAGCSASAWQSGPVLYVLVVNGGQGTYEQFLDLPRGPVT